MVEDGALDYEAGDSLRRRDLQRERQADAPPTHRERRRRRAPREDFEP